MEPRITPARGQASDAKEAAMGEGCHLTFGSLFSGIGGVDLGFERTGMQCAWQVEIDDYCNRVLEKHWPDVRRWRDVRTFPPSNAAEDWCVDVIAGGFPCQDISIAGRRAGIDGERSGLWSDYARIIRALRPSYVFVENVAALLDNGMGRVLGDLAQSGYDAEWESLPAAVFGAPHERERVFLVAYPSEVAGERGIIFDHCDDFPHDAQWSSTQGIESGREWKRWLSEAIVAVDGQISARDFCGMDDGVSEELDAIGRLGNAVVPQVAEFVGRLILKHACPTQ